jgi:SAM-dependent methyltransferase
MAKPSDKPPVPRRPLPDQITPGPEITIDAGTPPPDLVMDTITPPPITEIVHPDEHADDGLRTPLPEVLVGEATPLPELVIGELTPPPVMTDGPLPAPSAEKLPTPRPMPSAWAAQPLAPMQDEATVPLPVEEVEFASPEGHFGDGRAQLRTADLLGADGARVPPALPARPPAPPTAEGAARAVPGTDSPRPELLGSPGRQAPPPAPEPGRGRPPAPSVSSSSPPLPVAIAASSSGPHPLLPPGATWSEALSQRPRKKRLKPWFEEAFDEDYLRTLPFLTPEQTLREVEFLKDSFRLPRDAELLDVGCGYGRHAIELGQGGYRVTGIDLSLPLLIRAADEAQRRSLSVNFVHADMREMAFDAQFDGAYSFLTSFGYFDEETNLKVAASVQRALRPGGRFLLDTLNRDYIVTDLPTRVWWEGEGCVVLEEVDFNYQTSRLTVRRSVVFQDGRQVEHEMSIRAYSLHELGKLLRQAGFRILEVSGGIATRGNFFGAASRSVMVLCERPAD